MRPCRTQINISKWMIFQNKSFITYIIYNCILEFPSGSWTRCGLDGELQEIDVAETLSGKRMTYKNYCRILKI